ncbi:MAG: TonB-dependent siderophore receptor [Aphanocapsa sp. GSE-SYN-MK-11-07L]|jgi:iron complex outermembrane receptor protein|nr:TonB-dependent siderophore receptor [Aphanocapsa sp. GSE-SYN-MK-11-07L]
MKFVVVWSIRLGLAVAGLGMLELPVRAEMEQIESVGDRPPVSIRAADLVAQPSKLAQTAAPSQITGVKLNPRPTELEIVLETADGRALEVDASKFTSEGNTLIAEIPNAVLTLPDGQAFQAENPSSDITKITVEQQSPTSIRISVVGNNTLPTTDVVLKTGAFSYSLNPDPEGAEEEIVVTGAGQDGYFVTDATTATKTDTPLRDIPASIQVIPRQLLEDRQVRRVDQAADNVPGVQVDVTQGGLPAAEFFIRGFNSFLATYRDGFRSDANVGLFNVASIERIEFLKGPASVLYGQNEPGGIVNIVSKQPLTQPYYAPSLTIGSFDFYSPTLDISGPLNSQKTVAYRLNLAYENAGSFRDFVNSENIFVAPALSWQIGKNTKLTFIAEYQKFNYAFDRGFAPTGPEIFQVPISRNLGEPDFNDATAETGRASYVLEHQFSENWKLRHGFAAVISNFDKSEITPFFLQEDRRTIDRAAVKENNTSQNLTLQNEVVGKFRTGFVAHQVLLGVELYRQKNTIRSSGAEIAPIDLFNPVYGAEPGVFSLEADEESLSDALGIYFQDQITLLSNLKLLVGGRFDLIRTIRRDFLNDSVPTDSTDFAFSPRAGIVYQPIEPVSLYFSYATSFNPNLFGTSATGEAFEPEKGEQFEVGIKADLLSKRLAATLAAFQIRKENVLVTDPNDPDFSIQTGEQKSRGMEFNLVGRPVNGWNVVASYAYTDAFVSKDTDPLLVGDRLTQIPRHQLGLFNTYEIQRGTLKGLGFNLGLYYVSGDREANLPNDGLRLPSYFRVDTGIFYKRDNWKLQLNVNNLTNIDYYNSNGFFIVPQPPLTVLGKVSVEF